MKRSGKQTRPTAFFTSRSIPKEAIKMQTDGKHSPISDPAILPLPAKQQEEK